MTEGFARTQPGERPSIDRLIRALSHSRRRLILCHLDGRPLSTETTDLARAIAVAENRRPGETDEDAAIESSLFHVHLPSLQDVGLIDWNRETDRVQLTADAAALPVLSHLEDRKLEIALFGPGN